MEEAKSEILSYEEFVQVKEADKAKKITVQAEIPKIYNAVDIANEPTIESLMCLSAVIILLQSNL